MPRCPLPPERKLGKEAPKPAPGSCVSQAPNSPAEAGYRKEAETRLCQQRCKLRTRRLDPLTRSTLSLFLRRSWLPAQPSSQVALIRKTCSTLASTVGGSQDSHAALHHAVPPGRHHSHGVYVNGSLGVVLYVSPGLGELRATTNSSPTCQTSSSQSGSYGLHLPLPAPLSTTKTELPSPLWTLPRPPVLYQPGSSPALTSSSVFIWEATLWT